MAPCRIAIFTTAPAGRASPSQAPGALRPQAASPRYRAIQGAWQSGGSRRMDTCKTQTGIAAGDAKFAPLQIPGINGSSLHLQAPPQRVRLRQYPAVPTPSNYFGSRRTGTCRMRPGIPTVIGLSPHSRLRRREAPPVPVAWLPFRGMLPPWKHGGQELIIPSRIATGTVRLPRDIRI